MNKDTGASQTAILPGDLLDENQAADILCVKATTLRNWRALKKGPRFVRVGTRIVRYFRNDLAAFLTSTAATEAA